MACTLFLLCLVRPVVAVEPLRPLPLSGLQGALQAAFRASPLLQAKAAEILAREEAAAAARSLRYPSLSLSASARSNGTRPAAIQIQQPIWAFNRIDSQIDYADQELALEHADALRLRRGLAEDVAVAYAEVHGRMQILASQQETLAQLRDLESRIRRRQSGRLASDADLRLAEARVVQASVQRQQAEFRLQQAQTRLTALTRHPIDARPLPTAELAAWSNWTQVRTAILERSADLRVQSARISLAATDIDRQSSASLPTLFLEAGHEWAEVNGLEFEEDTVALTLKAQLDAFGVASLNQTQAARARLEAARARNLALRDSLLEQVETLYTEQQSNLQFAAALEQSIEALKQTAVSWERQYQSGRRDWLDLLNIERELGEQREQRHEVMTHALIAGLRLAAQAGRMDVWARPQGEISQ